MSMFSELSTIGEVGAYCREIERLLETEEDLGAVRALKQIGRFALTRFEWSEPEWAKEYHEMFKER